MRIRKYQKKTTKISGVQLTYDNIDNVVLWTGGNLVVEHDGRTPVGVIITQGGDTILCEIGDYILEDSFQNPRNIKPTFKVWSKIDFEQDYEEVR